MLESDEDPTLGTEEEEQGSEDDTDDARIPSQETIGAHGLHSKWTSRTEELVPMLLRDYKALETQRASMPPGEDRMEVDMLLAKVREAIGRARYGDDSTFDAHEKNSGEERTQNEVQNERT